MAPFTLTAPSGFSLDQTGDRLYYTRPDGKLAILYFSELAPGGESTAQNAEEGRRIAQTQYGIDLNALPKVNPADMEQLAMRVNGISPSNGVPLMYRFAPQDFSSLQAQQTKAISQNFNTDPAIANYTNPNAVSSQTGNFTPQAAPVAPVAPTAPAASTAPAAPLTPQQQTQYNNLVAAGAPPTTAMTAVQQIQTAQPPATATPDATASLNPQQKTQYDQLIAAGASPSSALFAAQQVPASTTTTASSSTPATTQNALAFDPKFGVSTEQWNQMNDVQRATIAAAYSAKQQAYQTDGQQLTFADALANAAKDPNIISKYADAAKLDAQAFSQGLQTLQQSTSTTAQQNQMQFEHDRRALADSAAAAGQAYSGFRGRAQEQLGKTESGIVQSSRADLQSKVNTATREFESKYGTGSTNPASLQFTDPFGASNVSLSGQYKPANTGTDTLTGALAGGITGSQPIAQQGDVNAKATQLYNVANFVPKLT